MGAGEPAPADGGLDAANFETRRQGVSPDAYWRSLDTNKRLILVAAGVVGLLLIALEIVRVARSPGSPPPLKPPAVSTAAPSWRGFAASQESLLCGPDAAFATVGMLERGEPVERLDTRRDYALVRDDSGRVGYVRSSALSATAPPVTADTPFVRCQRRPLELDISACEQRGREQLEACRTGCKSDGCAEQCSTRFTDCRLGCTQPVAPLAPGVAGGTAQPSLIPANGSATAGDDSKDEAAKAKKTKGKKAKTPLKHKGKHKGLTP